MLRFGLIACMLLAVVAASHHNTGKEHPSKGAHGSKNVKADAEMEAMLNTLLHESDNEKAGHRAPHFRHREPMHGEHNEHNQEAREIRRALHEAMEEREDSDVLLERLIRKMAKTEAKDSELVKVMLRIKREAAKIKVDPVEHLIKSSKPLLETEMSLFDADKVAEVKNMFEDVKRTTRPAGAEDHEDVEEDFKHGEQKCNLLKCANRLTRLFNVEATSIDKIDPINLFMQAHRMMQTTSGDAEAASHFTVKACTAFNSFNKCLGGDFLKCFDTKKLANIANTVVHALPLPATEDVKITPEKVEEVAKYFVDFCEHAEKTPMPDFNKCQRDAFAKNPKLAKEFQFLSDFAWTSCTKPSADFIKRLVNLLVYSTKAGCGDEVAKLTFTMARAAVAALKPETIAEHPELAEAIRTTVHHHEEKCHDSKDNTDMDFDSMKEDFCNYCDNTCERENTHSKKSNKKSNKKVCSLCDEVCYSEHSDVSSKDERLSELLSKKSSKKSSKHMPSELKNMMKKLFAGRKEHDDEDFLAHHEEVESSPMKKLRKLFRNDEEEELTHDDREESSPFAHLLAKETRHHGRRHHRETEEESEETSPLAKMLMPLLSKEARRPHGRRPHHHEETSPLAHLMAKKTHHGRRHHEEEDVEETPFHHLMAKESRRHHHDEEETSPFAHLLAKETRHQGRRHHDEEETSPFAHLMAKETRHHGRRHHSAEEMDSAEEPEHMFEHEHEHHEHADEKKMSKLKQLRNMLKGSNNKRFHDEF